MRVVQKRFPVSGIQFFIWILLCLAPLFADAQPSNDNFTNRTKITGLWYSTHEDNTLATAELMESNNFDYFNPPNHSLWWTWTAPTDEVVCISTRGSAVNTEMAVYTGDALDALTPVAHSTYYSISEVVFPVHKGTNYQITADSYYYGSTGKIALSLFPARVPENDDFANRKLLKGTSADVTGCSRFASIEPGESYGGAAAGSLWYSWTAPKTGSMSFELSQKMKISEYHLQQQRMEQVFVYTGDSLTNLTAQPNPWGYTAKVSNTFEQIVGNFSVTEGVTYQISVVTIMNNSSMLPTDSPFHLSFKLSDQ